MKSPAKVFALLIASVSVAGLFTMTTAAQDSSTSLTPAQIESIRNNCVTAQVSLQRLRDSDLTARTIRGRSYNDLNLLVRALNSRIALNGINAPDLIAVPVAFDTVYRSFYDHYTSYALALTNALNVHCENEPEQFYTLFLRAEQRREALEKDVADLHKLIAGYETGLLKLKDELAQPATQASGGDQ